jgi:Lrp/AsnC family leucine-responsive transcriptional regulator
MSAPVDDIDRQILDLLRENARMTNAAIGAKVGLSAPSVYERIRKLEKRGVIQGYTVRVDEAALGKKLTAFIRLTAVFDERHDPGIQAVAGDPDVLECYSVAGEDCFIVKTKVCEPADIQELLNRIRSHLNISRSVSMIVMNTLKE